MTATRSSQLQAPETTHHLLIEDREVAVKELHLSLARVLDFVSNVSAEVASEIIVS